MTQTLINFALDQVALPLASLLITAFIGWAAAKFHQWTGRQIEAKHREALQSALENGVRFALQKLIEANPQLDPSRLTGSERNQVLAGAEQYLLDSVPEALRHFNLEQQGRLAVDRLRDLILPKLPLPGE